jgi:hypothetical protein
MAIYLDVPFVSQLNYGLPKTKQNGKVKFKWTDPTGCWYCSAQMVAYYFEAGPRMGVPEIHSASGHAATGSDEAKNRLNLLGITKKKADHKLLAERENLVPIARCADSSHNYSLSDLETILRIYGPIFFYWKKGPAQYGHASVMIGTKDNGRVIYHDPEETDGGRTNIRRGSFTGDESGGRDREMSLAQFNSFRQRFNYGLMRRKTRAQMLASTVFNK